MKIESEVVVGDLTTLPEYPQLRKLISDPSVIVMALGPSENSSLDFVGIVVSQGRSTIGFHKIGTFRDWIKSSFEPARRTYVTLKFSQD